MARRPRPISYIVSAALLALLALPTCASAVISPAVVLDGPANNILDVDAGAMASDGSGGIVYRKEVSGVTHVFAVALVNGHWGAVVRVDGENPYNAAQATIAAGSGGRLLVVWVQPRNTSPKGILEYELVGASLQPGATGFGQTVVIDPNVGEPETGDVSAVAPTLAMAPNGVAYLVYRVLIDGCGLGDETNPERPRCRGGTSDKVVQVRVARFGYLRWSSLGAINRAPQIAMRNPTSSNAPSIGIDLNGNGVVAWQEPDSSGAARIWVRRLFGTVLGNVLEASPETVGGHPLSADADEPVLAVNPYGEARIVFRIQGASGSAVPEQLYLNSISGELGLRASQLKGVAPVPGATQSGLRTPSLGIDLRGNFRLAWAAGATVEQLTGSDEATGAPLPVGASAGQAQSAINPAGGGTTAWPGAAGAPAVDVREDYAGGAFQVAQLAGDVPGAVGGLSLAGSGQGDALLGWTQGPVGRSELVGDFVQAPPAPFNVATSSSWVRSTAAAITWEASPDAVAGVTYTVYVDGKPRLGGLTVLAARLSPSALGDGVHHVQVLATDAAGQQTMSSAHTLKVDANAPTVTLRLIDRRRGVRVTVRDSASGVKGHATKISFGDGSRVDGRAQATHEYRHAGLYHLTAQVRDKVGNSALVHLRIRVS